MKHKEPGWSSAKIKSVAPERQNKLNTLMQSLNYKFQHLNWLEEALTHRSKHSINNERLEFLGDSILGFLIADQLYLKFPEASEGELSRSRASLVKGETLSKLALRLNIGEYLRLGPGELKSGGFRRHSTLADAFEAVIGAIYRDGGMDAASAFVENQFKELLSEIKPDQSLKDPKTRLQEYLQARRYELPVYSIESTTGSVHEQVFEVSCVVESLSLSSNGSGSSRRKAEQMAAEKMLNLIRSQEHS